VTTYNRRDMPHPTLKAEQGSSDYETPIAFNAELVGLRRSAEAGEISIALRYGLNSPVLRNLIQTQQAHYHTLTECVATKLRESHRTHQETQLIQLKSDQYQGPVTIRPFILASVDIAKISNVDWKQPFRELLPDGTPVPRGSILAIGREKTFDPDASTELESIIEIAPSQAVERNRYKIDLSGQRIVIQINPDDKPDIDRVRRDEEALQALYPSMYQRAIEEAVRQHRKDEHSDKRWASRIADKLAEHNIDTDEEILDAHSLEYTQQIMENPLARITTPAENRQPDED
jgi:hypothetical protein